MNIKKDFFLFAVSEFHICLIIESNKGILIEDYWFYFTLCLCVIFSLNGADACVISCIRKCACCSMS